MYTHTHVDFSSFFFFYKRVEFILHMKISNEDTSEDTQCHGNFVTWSNHDVVQIAENKK